MKTTIEFHDGRVQVLEDVAPCVDVSPDNMLLTCIDVDCNVMTEEMDVPHDQAGHLRTGGTMSVHDLRESGSSDTHRPTPSGPVVSTRRTYEALLSIDDKPVHRYWSRSRERPRSSWLLRVLRLALPLVFLSTAATAQTITWSSNAPRITPAEAAAILVRLQPPPPCTDCDGPHIINTWGTPGALSWLAFPPESPRRRLDGTLLTQRPDGGAHASYWLLADSVGRDPRGRVRDINRSVQPVGRR